jgi:hypothetical protein
MKGWYLIGKTKQKKKKLANKILTCVIFVLLIT